MPHPDPTASTDDNIASLCGVFTFDINKTVEYATSISSEWRIDCVVFTHAQDAEW
jgi:hypothetical protein